MNPEAEIGSWYYKNYNAIGKNSERRRYKLWAKPKEIGYEIISNDYALSEPVMKI